MDEMDTEITSTTIMSPESGAVGEVQGRWSPLVDAWVRMGVLTADQASQMQSDMDHSGAAPHAILIDRHWASRADAYEAIERLPPALRPADGRLIRSVTDLPEWSTVLNDAGGALGGAERDAGMLALAASEDLGRTSAAGVSAPRCFLIGTEEAFKAHRHLAVLTRAQKAGYVIRAQLTLASPQIAAVVWSKWDERRGVKVGPRASGKGSQIATAQSDMQKLFDEIGPKAYLMGASDIHLLAKDGEGSVLFRIDGDVIRQPYDMTAEDIFRLAAAIYDTYTEKGSVKEGFSPILTQDGSIDRPYPQFRLRFRYSGNPVEPNGYRVAQRIIPVGTYSEPKSFVELGYARSHAEVLDEAFDYSSGMILLMGTTGSGKSTTLSNRASILMRERPTKVMLTVEDPVESIIPGAHQTQLRRQEGETTARALHRIMATLMRQDPDMLLVGEIRDLETANLALQGVRSGHLLLSTLHAGSSIMGYDRLAGLGVPRLDLATMGLVRAFVFQALVQKLCPVCRLPVREFLSSRDERIAGILQRLRMALDQGLVPGASTTGDGLDGIYFRHPSPTDCAACHGRGIQGRTLGAEVFVPTPEMLPFIAKGDSFGLWEAWRSQIHPKDPSDMRGRTAIEHALWQMASGDVDPRQVESQFHRLNVPMFAPKH